MFVSTQAISRSPAHDLVEALRAAGVQVAHSPRNPADGPDDAWTTWYALGLREALRGAGIAVLVVDEAWSSSTWMAQESDAAFSELGPDRVAFWNPTRTAVTALGMLRYLKARLPDGLTDAVALLSRRAASGLQVDVDAQIRDQWRELGFFYDVDDDAKAWRFRGTREGLNRFVTELEAYVQRPSSAVESEHEHLGPYMYLKVVTSRGAFVNGNAIGGTLSDLARLARLFEQRLRDTIPGTRFSIQQEFSPTAEYELDVCVELDGFDPAAPDTSILTVAG
jgi:hypothetical protein